MADCGHPNELVYRFPDLQGDVFGSFGMISSRKAEPTEP